MAKKKSMKRELMEWGIFIAIISTLYLTGLHTPILGALQGLILKTGIIQPDTEENFQGLADYNFHLEDTEGNVMYFEELKGKTIFVNLWATWCPPCIAEMPDINALYLDLDSKDVAFVMISLDDNFEKAKSFVNKKGYQFPIYQLKTRLPKIYESPSIPTTYVISPDGNIVMSKKGMAKYNTKDFKAFLLNL